MKKSIATIALFTLALVTTSFTTQETSGNFSNTVSMDPPPLGGVCVGCGNKKLDVSTVDTSTNTNLGQVNGFATDKQSLGNIKKLD